MRAKAKLARLGASTNSLKRNVDSSDRAVAGTCGSAQRDGATCSQTVFGTLSNLTALSAPVHFAELALTAMIIRTTLLTGAAILLPVATAANAQDASAQAPTDQPASAPSTATQPSPAQPSTAQSSAGASQGVDDIPQEQQLVVVGHTPR